MKKYYITTKLEYDYAFELPDEVNELNAIVFNSETQDPIWDKIFSLIYQNPEITAYLCQTAQITDAGTGEVIWKV